MTGGISLSVLDKRANLFVVANSLNCSTFSGTYIVGLYELIRNETVLACDATHLDEKIIDIELDAVIRHA